MNYYKAAIVWVGVVLCTLGIEAAKSNTAPTKPKGRTSKSEPASIESVDKLYREEEAARLENVYRSISKLTNEVTRRKWPQTWQLDMKCRKPGRIIVGKPKHGEAGTPYIYIVYTLTNNTKSPVPLRVSVELRTEFMNKRKKEYYEISGEDILQTIRLKEKNPRLVCYPSGTLQPGQKIECISIFSDVCNEAVVYDFVFYGLNDAYKVDVVEGKVVMYHKVLHVVYERPGDTVEFDWDLIKHVRTEWVTETFPRRKDVLQSSGYPR